MSKCGGPVTATRSGATPWYSTAWRSVSSPQTASSSGTTRKKPLEVRVSQLTGHPTTGTPAARAALAISTSSASWMKVGISTVSGAVRRIKATALRCTGIAASAAARSKNSIHSSVPSRRER